MHDTRKARGRKQDPEVPLRITSAAIELFSDLGFQQTTVDDIAKRAGISRRTFFRYCPSKAEALWADIAGQLEELRTHILTAAEDRPVLSVVTDAFFATILKSDPRLIRARLLLSQEAPNDMAVRWSASARTEEVLVDCLAERLGPLGDSVYPRMVATCIAGAMRAANRAWVTQDRNDNWHDYVKAAFKYLEVGLMDGDIMSGSPPSFRIGTRD